MGVTNWNRYFGVALAAWLAVAIASGCAALGYSLSGHVARTKFGDVAWALAHPDIPTAAWSWRQVDVSTERTHLEGNGLSFVGPTTVQLNVCGAAPKNTQVICESLTRRFDIPLPIVPDHR